MVKVKSLTTDEIGLNDALAAAGIEAIETDLAELIIQLGRRPVVATSSSRRSTATARRSATSSCARCADVDPSLTDEPAALAEAARRHLRRKFLAAPVAISGANFAVAETGTLCVVESEGNGRMCLTLPQTLITVMGIEKVIPTWRDLEVFLQLLPRSSTGERMNPYTSIWTGSRRATARRSSTSSCSTTAAPRVLADRVGRQRSLHPLLSLPQRLPRLRAHRRACLRLGLPRPDRRHPDAAAHRHREHADRSPYASSLCGACYDVCPVRSTSRRCWCTCAHSMWRPSAATAGCRRRKP